MIEIVCPSCEAHYELPDGSIGPEGRKVSCSNCAHKWRAYPRGMEPAGEEAPAAPASDMPETSPESLRDSMRQSVRESMAEVSSGPTPGPTPEPEPEPEPARRTDPEAEREAIAASLAALSGTNRETAAPVEPPAAEGSRDEQMAAIRKMLADLKETADAAPQSEPDAAPPVEEPAGPTPVMRKRAEEEREEHDDRDPLKSRIDNLTQLNRAVRGEPSASGYDAAKLRRLHERRAKKFQRQRERRRKSGGFLTGFTLVAVVTATMVGLYVMKPQIVAASPEMAPAMNEYVAAIDGYRAGLNDATAQYKEWLVERIDKLRGKAEQEQEAAQ